MLIVSWGYSEKMSYCFTNKNHHGQTTPPSSSLKGMRLVQESTENNCLNEVEASLKITRLITNGDSNTDLQPQIIATTPLQLVY